MKRVITLCALALSWAMCATSPAFAEEPGEPNAVDVSQWNKAEKSTCYTNGVQTLFQEFTYTNGPFTRIISRGSVSGEVIYEREVMNFTGENGFEFKVFYLKKGNTWIRYNGDEGREWWITLLADIEKRVTKQAAIIPCDK